MGGPHVRWLLGAGLTSLLSLQSRGIGQVHAHTFTSPAQLLISEPLLGLVAEPLRELEPAVELEAPAELEFLPEPEPTPSPVMPPCPAELGLIGAVVNESDPQLSRVIVRTLGGAAVVAAGGRIQRFIVAAVKQAGAALRDEAGAFCALTELSSGVSSAPPPAPAQVVKDEAREPTPRGKPVFSAQELADGVRALADGEYLVKKAFLLKALTNPGGSAGGAWFRPAANDAGMEVLGVREGSALDAMGIRNGDIVHNLNGISLDAASGLIAALRSAREADQVSIAIVRAGAPRDMRYRVE